MDERKIFTVSQLNSAIRSLLESKFPFIHVAGEISNLHRPYSGHNYFTLKDSGAQIKAVLFKTQQRYLSRPIKEGDQVVCRGRISVYEPRGDYQVIVDTVEYQGAGALQQAYEQLKRKLALEGLFDEHTKRPLPRFPEHIGLITSPQGAAVHDFIRIANRRWPQLRISILPVSVQGTTAAGDMIQALTAMNTQVHPDVIVLCRGGGSIEDLWPSTMRTSLVPFELQKFRSSVAWAMRSISPLPILPQTCVHQHQAELPSYLRRTCKPSKAS